MSSVSRASFGRRNAQDSDSQGGAGQRWCRSAVQHEGREVQGTRGESGSEINSFVYVSSTLVSTYAGGGLLSIHD